MYEYRIEVTLPLRGNNPHVGNSGTNQPSALIDWVVYEPDPICGHCDIKHGDSLDATLNTTVCIEDESYSDAREFVNSDALREWVGLRWEIELSGEPTVVSIESDDDPCSCKLCEAPFGDCYETKEGE